MAIEWVGGPRDERIERVVLEELSKLGVHLVLLPGGWMLGSVDGDLTGGVAAILSQATGLPLIGPGPSDYAPPGDVVK